MSLISERITRGIKNPYRKGAPVDTILVTSAAATRKTVEMVKENWRGFSRKNLFGFCPNPTEGRPPRFKAAFSFNLFI
jgi:hypothetical protein